MIMATLEHGGIILHLTRLEALAIQNRLGEACGKDYPNEEMHEAGAAVYSILHDTFGRQPDE